MQIVKKRGKIVKNCQYLKSNCQEIVEITKEIVGNVQNAKIVNTVKKLGIFKTVRNFCVFFFTLLEFEK